MMLAQTAPVAELSKPHAIGQGSVKVLRPWIVSLFGGVGLASLLAGGFALLASPAALERAAALGDSALLALGIAGILACILICRAFLIRRRLPEERVDDARPQPRHLR